MNRSRRKSSRSRHAPSASRHHGRPSRRIGYFTRLLKDESISIKDADEARQFVSGMKAFESKVDLLQKIDDERYHGHERVEECLSQIETMIEVRTLVLPILELMQDPDIVKPTFKKSRLRVLRTVFFVPGLMEILIDLEVPSQLSVSEAQTLCDCLLEIASVFIDARSSRFVSKLSIDLLKRGDIEEKARRLAFVLNDGEGKQSSQIETKEKSVKSACWVTDLRFPGDRHDNDRRNFRDIQLVPTLQEINCEAHPYLPLATGENSFIEDSALNHLDGCFRLLREDAVQNMKSKLKEKRRVWSHARIVGIQLAGVQNPKGFSKMSFVLQLGGANRVKDWQRSRSFSQGSVIALCQGGTPVRLATVSVRQDDSNWLRAVVGPKIGITVTSEEAFQSCLREYFHNSSMNDELTEDRSKEEETAILELMVTYDVIEVSSSFSTYTPILKTLQTFDLVPLEEELIHMQNSSSRPLYIPSEVRLPAGKYFRSLRVHLESVTESTIVAGTSLDESQAKALLHTMKNRVSLIQGPPGCGKTFIGALIAKIIRENSDESILCVCYTNHALDQFLEHMLDQGEKSIVRLGGRSKSDQINPFQLKSLSRNKGRSNDAAVSFSIRRVQAMLHRKHEEIMELMGRIGSRTNWKYPDGGFSLFLQEEEPRIHGFLSLRKDAFNGEHDETFQVVGGGGRNRSLREDEAWKLWRSGCTCPRWLRVLLNHHDDDEANFDTFWSLQKVERRRMEEQWRERMFEGYHRDLFHLTQDFNELLEEKEAIVQAQDFQILQTAKVIGATTTGAAKHRDLLNLKGAGVVIVEEAGEVLEAHVLAALCESTKHLILIGDHRQLRPKVETYELTTVANKGYMLDCSMFERLIRGGFPYCTLDVQHRMRPSISSFVRLQTYPNLKDHPSVRQRPHVRGIAQDVVFFDHQELEDGIVEDSIENPQTKENTFEAEICTELVRFLLLQGYSPNDLVVLTPYLGQVRKMASLIREELANVSAFIDEHDQRDMEEMGLEAHEGSFQKTKMIRCSSVDNFQGEESRIVIISLVRSNTSGQIGFLKEPERVNVMLSRARDGMILVGNTKTLLASKRGQHVWQPLLELMQERKMILNGIPTTCQNHPEDDPVYLRHASEFRRIRPNGGCERPCTYRMGCGHTCPMMCHPFDQDHCVAESECTRPCRRFPPECQANHPCPNRCRDECGPCSFVMGPITLGCGHMLDRTTCHEIRSEEAKERLVKNCQERVAHMFSPCGHEIETACSNANSDNPICDDLCGKLVEACQHPCENLCGHCEGNHKCTVVCERRLFCGHLCGRSCHGNDPCPPCNKRCIVRCNHSRCPKPCGDACASCVEECDWSCEHVGNCLLVCGAPCSRLPCNQRCSQVLSCGHRCPSVCGEDCPSSGLCQVCANERVRSEVVDLELLESYEDHDIENDPILELPCGHFLAMSTLDRIFDLSSVYSVNETGEFYGLRTLIGSGVNEKPKGCPKCKQPMHSMRRYGRILRLIELRSLERKYLNEINAVITSQNASEASVTQKLKDLERVRVMSKKSPMQRVFEACGGKGVEVPNPPASLELRVLDLQASLLASKVEERGDKWFKKSTDTYQEAIEIAEASMSMNSNAKLRLSLAALLFRFEGNVHSSMTQATEHLKWIVANPTVSTTVRQQAAALLNDQGTRSVIEAMKSSGGYDFGTSWSDHWFECPNGHPYFIGECAGAMQTGRCIECGETVGGSSHRLQSTNRPAGSRVREMLR